MSVWCEGAQAKELVEKFEIANDIVNEASAFVCLAMGLTVTVYLFLRRKRQPIPRFAIVQLLMTDVLYFLLILLDSYKWFHDFNKQRFDESTTKREKMYATITYPWTMLMEVMYLNQNWIYVHRYLKAALLLPIILQKDDDLEL